MSNHLIRPYKENDKAACLNAFISNVPLYFTEDEVLDYGNFLDNYIIKQNHSDYRTNYFVLLIEGQLVACGGFGDRYLDGKLTLTWGLVHIDFHKKGLGKELLLYRLNRIKEQFPDSSVSIDTIQHSAGFFEKYGFKTIKITNDFYAQGLHRYDMVWHNITSHEF